MRATTSRASLSVIWPNTITLRAALTEAQGARVATRVVTTVVPQLRVASTVLGTAADTANMVGSATAELEVLDSATGERLVAAVDARAGTRVLFAGRTFTTWGDVQAAITFWSQLTAWQLARAGVQLKPGAAMPAEPEAARSL